MKPTYTDIVKIEFKDLINRLAGGGSVMHAYFLDRVCLSATTVGYSYGYFSPKGDDAVGKYLDLGSYGRLNFVINAKTQEAKVISHNYRQILIKFLKDFKVTSAFPNLS